jgi:hypothetical protein
MAADISMASSISLEGRQILFNDLVTTVKDCTERGMYYSAKW